MPPKRTTSRSTRSLPPTEPLFPNLATSQTTPYAPILPSSRSSPHTRITNNNDPLSSISSSPLTTPPSSAELLNLASTYPLNPILRPPRSSPHTHITNNNNNPFSCISSSPLTTPPSSAELLNLASTYPLNPNATYITHLPTINRREHSLSPPADRVNAPRAGVRITERDRSISPPADRVNAPRAGVRFTERDRSLSPPADRVIPPRTLSTVTQRARSLSPPADRASSPREGVRDTEEFGDRDGFAAAVRGITETLREIRPDPRQPATRRARVAQQNEEGIGEVLGTLDGMRPAPSPPADDGDSVDSPPPTGRKGRGKTGKAKAAGGKKAKAKGKAVEKEPKETAEKKPRTTRKPKTRRVSDGESIGSRLRRGKISRPEGKGLLEQEEEEPKPKRGRKRKGAATEEDREGEDETNTQEESSSSTPAQGRRKRPRPSRNPEEEEDEEEPTWDNPFTHLHPPSASVLPGVILRTIENLPGFFRRTNTHTNASEAQRAADIPLPSIETTATENPFAEPEYTEDLTEIMNDATITSTPPLSPSMILLNNAAAAAAGLPPPRSTVSSARARPPPSIIRGRGTAFPFAPFPRSAPLPAPVFLASAEETFRAFDAAAAQAAVGRSGPPFRIESRRAPTYGNAVQASERANAAEMGGGGQEEEDRPLFPLRTPRRAPTYGDVVQAAERANAAAVPAEENRPLFPLRTPRRAPTYGDVVQAAERVNAADAAAVMDLGGREEALAHLPTIQRAGGGAGGVREQGPAMNRGMEAVVPGEEGEDANEGEEGEVGVGVPSVQLPEGYENYTRAWVEDGKEEL